MHDMSVVIKLWVFLTCFYFVICVRKKKTNARIPLTFSFESKKLDYNQRCITHNKWFFVISGYFWYGVLEGKRVSYILVTVFFPKFHLKFTLTNSVTNTNRLDSNAHLGLFSNGWIRFKVRSKYQCFKKWKHRGCSFICLYCRFWHQLMVQEQ